MPVWTDEVVERLRQLAAEGKTRPEIRAELGINRNQLAGAAYRFNVVIEPKHRADGQPRRVSSKKTGNVKVPKAKKPTPTRKTPFVVRSAVPLQKVVSASDIVPLNLTFMQLGPNQCRYPYGDAPPYLYCGHVTGEGESYCTSHKQCCAQKPRITAGKLQRSCRRFVA